MGKKLDSTAFTLDELYRQLRINIEFSKIDGGMKVISVISTQPKEGKSNVALHLARVYADQYERVLLMDCDLRAPSLARMLETSGAMGLGDLLMELDSIRSIENYGEIQIIEQSNGKKLYFLPAGRKVLNPAELFLSRRFAVLMEMVRQQFDVVIIDCPPASLFSDCVPISSLADGSLFVVSAKETNKYRAREIVRDLQRNGINLIGTVLTKVPDDGKHRILYDDRYGYSRYFDQQPSGKDHLVHE